MIHVWCKNQTQNPPGAWPRPMRKSHSAQIEREKTTFLRITPAILFVRAWFFHQSCIIIRYRIGAKIRPRTPLQQKFGSKSSNLPHLYGKKHISKSNSCKSYLFGLNFGYVLDIYKIQLWWKNQLKNFLRSRERKENPRFWLKSVWMTNWESG